MSNGPTHVIVRAAAPIPVGDEIDVYVVRHTEKSDLHAVLVRHIATSVMYGGSGLFDEHLAHPIIGDPELYRSPRLSRHWAIVRTFQARVRECVVSNLAIDQGNGDSYVAATTSFLVEPTAAPPQAYR